MSCLEYVNMTEDACDFQVRVDGTTFDVHRSKISSGSPFFQTMMSVNMQESSKGYVNIPHLTAEGVESCLRFIYTNELQISNSKVEEIFSASDYFQMNELNQRCCQHIIDNLQPETCISFYNILKLHGKQVEVEQVEKYITKRFDRVITSDAFHENCEEDLIACLQLQKICPKLHWKATEKWMNENSSDNILQESLQLLVDKEGISIPWLVGSVWCAPYVQSRVTAKSIVAQNLEKRAKWVLKEFKTGNCENLHKCLEENNGTNFVDELRRQVSEAKLQLEHRSLAMTSTRSDCIIWMNPNSSSPEKLASLNSNGNKIAAVAGHLYLVRENHLYKFSGDEKLCHVVTLPINLARMSPVLTFQNKIYVIERDRLVCFDPLYERAITSLPGCGLPPGFCVAASNDYIYTFGGEDSKKARRYDPLLYEWSDINSMKDKRWEASAAVHRGKVYVAGGLDSTNGPPKYMKSVEIYDPATDTWESVGEMIHYRHYFSLVSHDEKLFAVGGTCDTNGRQVDKDYIETYDVELEKWKVVKEMKRWKGRISSCIYSEKLIKSVEASE